MKSMKRFALGMIALMMIGLFAGQTMAASALKTVEKNCAGIVTKTTETEDTEQVKLKKLFQYVENNYGYKRSTSIPTTVAALAACAKNTIKSKAGSCYDFAAVYAFLAKKATGYTVRVVLGETKGFGHWQKHAWTEIKIGKTWYICDANLDKFKADCKLKFFMKKKTGSAMKKNYRKGSNYKAITIKF